MTGIRHKKTYALQLRRFFEIWSQYGSFCVKGKEEYVKDWCKCSSKPFVFRGRNTQG